MNYVDDIAKSLELEQFNESPLVKKISQVTKQKGERVTLILSAFMVLFLLVTNCGRYLLLLFFGFFYPVYKSYQALETSEDSDDKRWLTYWVVFGFFMATMEYL